MCIYLSIYLLEIPFQSEWIYWHDLIKRLSKTTIFLKFDLISGFWQIEIHSKDKYKTTFTTPIGHYEWNVMPF